MSPHPYRRRRPTLRQRLERINLRGWLWLAAGILAIVLIVLYFA
jgi:hypothetical protein